MPELAEHRPSDTTRHEPVMATDTSGMATALPSTRIGTAIR